MPVVELTLDSKGAVTSLNQYDKAVDNSAKNTEQGFSKMRASVTSIASVLGTTLVAGATAAAGAFVALAAAIVSAGERYREIENLSRLAKTGVEDFQNLAYATEQYGVQADHLADISKDVSDKLGDFIATGAGPFADFFENVAPKVGLTADALARLSGPDALIAVKKAMDDANVSMEEQIFYLESIGNDATLLIPLLEENGKLFRENAAQAKALGIALSQIQVDKLTEGQQAVAKLTKSVLAVKDKVLAEIAPAFTAFATMITEAFLASGQTIDSLAQTIAGKLLDSLSSVIEVIRFVHNGFSGLKLILQGIIVVFAEIAKAGVTAFHTIGEALVAAGLKDDNPFENLMKGAQDFSEASKEAFTAQVEGIVETNKKYDEMIAKVDTVVTSAKAGFGEVKVAVGEVKEEVKETTTAIGETIEKVEELASVTIDTANTTSGMVQSTDGTWTNLSETIVNVVKSTEDVATATNDKAIPAEEKLKTAVDAVTASARESSRALTDQATAVDKVSEAADRIQDRSFDRDLDSPSGGSSKKSMGSAPAVTAAEAAYINSMTAKSRYVGADGQHKGMASSFVTSGDRKRMATDFNLGIRSRENATMQVLDNRSSGESNPFSINNYFNQSMSRSDVVNVTEEQIRQGQRT